jgi:putative transposase
MVLTYPQNWPQFYTATISHWQNLLMDAKYKNVIINCLSFLVKQEKVKINGFVVMSNHVHIIWQELGVYTIREVQLSFKKHTSKEFLRLLREDNKLHQYEVNAFDRKHHFWKRNCLGIELFSRMVFYQKLNYIHENPVKAGLCRYAEEYKFSSAQFYKTQRNGFDFLEHYSS